MNRVDNFLGKDAKTGFGSNVLVASFAIGEDRARKSEQQNRDIIAATRIQLEALVEAFPKLRKFRPNFQTVDAQGTFVIRRGKSLTRVDLDGFMKKAL